MLRPTGNSLTGLYNYRLHNKSYMCCLGQYLQPKLQDSSFDSTSYRLLPGNKCIHLCSFHLGIVLGANLDMLHQAACLCRHCCTQLTRVASTEQRFEHIYRPQRSGSDYLLDITVDNLKLVLQLLISQTLYIHLQWLCSPSSVHTNRRKQGINLASQCSYRLHSSEV